MNGRSSRAAACLAAALACLAGAAAAEWTAAGIEVGPPSLSVSHEVRQALARAEAWLAAHPGEEPEIAEARVPESREAAEALLCGEGADDLRALGGGGGQLAAWG